MTTAVQLLPQLLGHQIWLPLRLAAPVTPLQRLLLQQLRVLQAVVALLVLQVVVKALLRPLPLPLLRLRRLRPPRWTRRKQLQSTLLTLLCLLQPKRPS